MLSIPLFFQKEIPAENSLIALNEDTAKHIVQVLRMQPGENILLTNGNGITAEATITTTQKKTCTATITKLKQYSLSEPQLHLAIAFTKNASRNEWLLEKITEAGVYKIYPLVTTRSERVHIRDERWKNILQSAMLQSQQCFLPKLQNAIKLEELIKQTKDVSQKLVAHCINDTDKHPIAKKLSAHKETLIFIGPEGDFTADEVALCKENGFAEITLGKTRLRTETAALSACFYFNLVNDETV